ncbi:MAG: uracil-DNA glycosylase family protein, partial [Verrucomicrobiales bacterium]|nr:uracil-DNA glycosylase family protein [Verrucomicrobiales bacterium]
MSHATNLKGALSLLEQILHRQKSTGVETVHITVESLTKLQSLPLTLMRASQPPPAATRVEPAPAPPTATITEAKSKPRPKVEVAAASPLPKAAEALEHPYGDLARRVEMRDRAEIIHPAGDNVREKLNNLFRIAKKCDICRGTETLRDQLVFATGNPEADLMFVGEAPGEEEEVQKKPFVGPAGLKLDQIINAMGLKREDVYITNIVKYRPKIGDGRFQGPKNRKPTPDEIAVFLKFVRSEIEVIKPKVIVALGGTAAEGLLEQSGSVSAMRGKFFELDGI